MASAYSYLGIPTKIFSLFVIGRTSGWSANVIEKLIMGLSDLAKNPVVPEKSDWVDIENR